MLTTKRTSANAGDAMEVDHTAEVATIDATPATIDRDMTAATDTTTNQNVETATVETAPKNGSWKKTSDDKNRRDNRDQRDDRHRRKKAKAHHVDNRYTSSDDDTKFYDKHTDVDKDNVSRSTVSSDAANDNFVVFESPAKLAAQAKRGSAVADKEVTVVRKRKPDAATVPCQGKKAKSNKKIVKSDSDEEDDDDENFLASCGKVLDRNPLDI